MLYTSGIIKLFELNNWKFKLYFLLWEPHYFNSSQILLYLFCILFEQDKKVKLCMHVFCLFEKIIFFVVVLTNNNAGVKYLMLFRQIKHINVLLSIQWEFLQTSQSYKLTTKITCDQAKFSAKKSGLVIAKNLEGVATKRDVISCEN